MNRLPINTGWRRGSVENNQSAEENEKKKSSYKRNGTSWTLSHLQDIQQNGVSPVENKLRFSLCTYVHFVLAQKHISRNT